jgi:hypothetical protein
MNHTSGNVHHFDAILSFHRVCDFRPAQYMFTGPLPYMLFGANPRFFIQSSDVPKPLVYSCDTA